MGFKLKSGNNPKLEGGLLTPSCDPGLTIAIVQTTAEPTPMKKYNHKKEVRKANRQYKKDIKNFEKNIANQSSTKDDNKPSAEDIQEIVDMNDSFAPKTPGSNLGLRARPEGGSALAKTAPLKQGVDAGEGYMPEGEAGPRNYKAQLGGPYLKATPYKEDDDKDDDTDDTTDDSDDFNMMDNPPPDDTTDDTMGPDPDPGTDDTDTTDATDDKTEDTEDKPDPDTKSGPDPEPEPEPEPVPEPEPEPKTVEQEKQDTESTTVAPVVKSDSEMQEEAFRKQQEDEVAQHVGDTLKTAVVDKVTGDIKQGAIKEGAEKLAATKMGKKLATKTAAKVAAKVALKGATRLIPGVGQIMMARDMYKLGKYAYQNRDKLAGWASRQKSNMSSRLRDWMG